MDGYAVKKEGQEAIKLYNKEWTRRGYIKKEGDRAVIYDKDWKRQGYIKSIDGYEPERRR